jgi:hypothetical protein
VLQERPRRHPTARLCPVPSTQSPHPPDLPAVPNPACAAERDAVRTSRLPITITIDRQAA